MSLAAAIFSDSQARVLRWLFGQPARSFHMSELLRLTGLGSASLQRELKRLADAGIVTSERIGNQRHFRVDRDGPLFAELESLTRKTMGVEPLIRDALAGLADRVVDAWIYGSIAKQTDTGASDIDLMIVGGDLTQAEVHACLESAESALGRRINPVVYTPREFARRRSEAGSFVAKVLAAPTIRVAGVSS